MLCRTGRGLFHGGAMIAVVAPQPVAWMQQVCALARQRFGTQVAILAPWSLAIPSAASDGSLTGLRALSARFGAKFATRLAFVRRRMQPAGDAAIVRAGAGWLGVEALSLAYGHNDAARAWHTRFGLRVLADAWAAKRILSLMQRNRLHAVIAPTWAAQRVFAIARAAQAATVLIEDYPQLRRLNQDLDALAVIHTDAMLARRVRASTAMIVRQEQEQVLATERWSRAMWDPTVQALGASTGARHIAAGPPATLHARATQPAAAVPFRVLLAGPPLARNGSFEALAMLTQHPSMQLYILHGEAGEPAALLSHARVTRVQAGAIPWHRIDAVIAPAWCETARPELAEAIGHQIPVWATLCAAAHLPDGAWQLLDRGAVPFAAERCL